MTARAVSTLDAAPCPCGTGRAFAECCGPYLDGHPAPTAEALMRSRYTAFALAGRHASAANHLWRTWHPSKRPEDVTPDPGQAWEGLVLTEVVDGDEDDEAGEVAFTARWRRGRAHGVLTERSFFVRRAGRWVYFDGDVN
ncbi:YchJ family protein [Luteococcus japonicus]|uniref:YchJ family protein n=1 Tax=Luteococcus japonicus TaxID=33984 RepID=UPI000B9BA8A4|nr:YchJ family metal-binding protein [Luteococcus japonicus]